MTCVNTSSTANRKQILAKQIQRHHRAIHGRIWNWVKKLSPYLFSATIVTVITSVAALGTVWITAAAAAFATLGMAIFLKDRWVTRSFATALVSAIIALSLAVLFPVTLPVLYPLAGFVCGAAFTYALIQSSRKLASL